MDKKKVLENELAMDKNGGEAESYVDTEYVKADEVKEAAAENITETFALFQEDEYLSYCPQGPMWVRLDSVMDSGAAESVAPAELAPWRNLKGPGVGKRT